MSHFSGGRAIGANAIGVPCEIWIPAARTGHPHRGQRERPPGQAGHPGREHPGHRGAERRTHAHRILSVPDFIANAGGVICAIEYHGGTQAQAFATIEERIGADTARRSSTPARPA